MATNNGKFLEGITRPRKIGGEPIINPTISAQKYETVEPPAQVAPELSKQRFAVPERRPGPPREKVALGWFGVQIVGALLLLHSFWHWLRRTARSVFAPHSPVALQNIITMEVVGPDGLIKDRRVCYGNLMMTQGLTTLAKLIATGGEASGWISAGAIGTDTTAANSTQSSLGASTAIVHRTAASMAGSDLGNMTARLAMTFASNNPAGAAVINEIGLFGTNAATNRMVARTVLGTASVNKGASDSINVSYDIVVKTAA